MGGNFCHSYLAIVPLYYVLLLLLPIPNSKFSVYFSQLYPLMAFHLHMLSSTSLLYILYLQSFFPRELEILSKTVYLLKLCHSPENLTVDFICTRLNTCTYILILRKLDWWRFDYRLKQKKGIIKWWNSFYFKSIPDYQVYLLRLPES